MGRLSRSWDLFKTSLTVVKQDKELLWMPVLSFLASILAVLSIVGVGFALAPAIFVGDGISALGFLLAFALYILLAFVSLFFGAAVVAAANTRLAGGDPTVGSSIKAAWGKVGKIFVWSIIVATVNVILQAIRESSARSNNPVSQIVGPIMAGIAGTAWNLATFFMVPILLFEDKKLGDSLKSSGRLFKQTWGESAVGLIGIGWAATLVGIGVFLAGMALTYVLAGALGMVGLVIGIAILVLGMVFMACLSSVLQGVYKAALYRYATTGQAGPFQAQVATAQGL